MESSGSVSSQFAQFRGPARAWVGTLALTFVAAAGWIFLRTFDESTTFRPPLQLDETLKPQDTGLNVLSPFFRLGYDFHVTHVGERPVATMTDYRAALKASGTGSLRLRLASEDPRGPREMLLARAPDFPPLADVLDSDLIVVDPLPTEFYDLPILPGDRLTQVEGHELSNAAQIPELEKNFPKGSNGIVQWYSLERPGVGPVEMVLYRVDWRTYWLLYAAGLMFGILGFVVFALKPHTRSAWGFLFFCWSFGIFWLMRSVAAQTRTVPEYYVFQLWQALLPLPALVLLVTFSPLRLVFRRVAPVAALALAFGIGLVAVNQALNPGQVYLSFELFGVWGLVMLGVLIWGMTMDLWLRLRGVYVGTAERLRGRVVRLACLMAFGPVVFHTLFSLWTDIWDFQMWFELCVLLFPLIIGYAIIRHDMLHINEMLAQGAVLFSLLLIVGFLFSQGAMASDFIASRVPSLDSSILQGFVLMVLFIAAGPIQNLLRQKVRQYFDRPDPMLETFADELEHEDFFSLHPAEFFANMLKELAGRAKTPFTSLNLFHPHGGWWLGGKTGLAVLGPTTQECGALFNLMSASPTEISSEGIADDLRLSGVRQELSQAMKAVRASYVMPLISENRLLGILTLGDKDDFRNRTPAELGTLRRMAASCTAFVEKQFELAQESVSFGAETQPLPSQRPIALNYPQCPPWIGPYRIEQAIGKGGMAFVFRGITEEMEQVAIKVPNLMVQHNHEMLRRFMLEGRMMHRMQHPNLISVIDVGRHEKEPYLVMRYLAHGSLADRLKREGRIPESDARRIAMAVARGLDHALRTEHLFHRDIKPANIMIGPDGEPIVADFGLAKIVDGSQISENTRGALGTPAYMSPEVCAGKDRDWRADQYALGVMLFEMLCGRRPFKSESLEQLLLQHMQVPPPDLREICPELSDHIVRITERLLEKKPEDRYPTYGALIDELANDPGEAPTLVPGATPVEPEGPLGSTSPLPASGEAKTIQRPSS